MKRFGVCTQSLIFGRMFGTLAKHTLEERRTILAGYLELYDMVNKTPASPVKLPETVPSEASEAVVKVEIPAEPNLPNIPSVAAPEEAPCNITTTDPSERVSPTFTFTSLTTPAWDEGTSIVALSDSKTTIDCSFSTLSPAFTFVTPGPVSNTFA